VTQFRFSLERVLELRRVQLQAEEEKLARLQQQLEGIDQRVNAIASTELKSEWALRKMPAVAASDLHTLSDFQARVRKVQAALAVEKQQVTKEIQAQRARLLNARREFRVIEKLKERRFKVWQYQADREIEGLAADAHNSKLIRLREDEPEMHE
jgi:flagellar export protein FliJ